MSLPESEDRNPYFTVGIVGALRFKGKSYEEVAEYLRFSSVEEMRTLLESWELPGWLVGAEANSGKNRVQEKRAPRLRSAGPRQDLPPAGNATELFIERLEALLKDAELLEHINEGLYGKYFGRTNVETASVLQDGSWTDDVVVSLPGRVALTPSETLVILIGVYALAGGQMDLLLEALHPDGLSASDETREEIRQYVEGSRADDDKRDGLKILAPNLAAWVRGGGSHGGRRPERSEMDHAVASITTKYRKDGLTYEEITRKLEHLEKEDGTSYSIKDVTELGDLGLSWS